MELIIFERSTDFVSTLQNNVPTPGHDLTLLMTGWATYKCRTCAAVEITRLKGHAASLAPSPWPPAPFFSVLTEDIPSICQPEPLTRQEQHRQGRVTLSSRVSHSTHSHSRPVAKPHATKSEEEKGLCSTKGPAHAGSALPRAALAHLHRPAGARGRFRCSQPLDPACICPGLSLAPWGLLPCELSKLEVGARASRAWGTLSQGGVGAATQMPIIPAGLVLECVPEPLSGPRCV